jgi:cytidylate kinase
MRVPRVVAIDGAAGSGKSTLARALARALGLPYINTGLMYRALAAAAIRAGRAAEDADGLIELLQRLQFSVTGSDPPELEVEGYGSAELTSPAVESTVSAVARHPAVRERMRALQRSMGNERGAVMEGRDIGSVVFADAPVKLYLIADPDARATRRAEERGTGDDLGEALHHRDRVDAQTNPHVPAPGADMIETTALGIDETVAAALRIVRERAPHLVGDGGDP